MRQVVVDGSPAAVTELFGGLRAALDGSGPPVVPVDPGVPVTGSEPAAGIALVVPTSGSTGDAKGVLLAASALRASATATHGRLGGPGRWLLALPARHIAGVQVLVRSILAGHDPALMDTSAGFRPHGFAEAASGVLVLGGPRYTALVPTQLARLVEAGGDGLRALRGFDAVLLGGAATPSALLERARAAGVRVVTTYGMTETAGGCVYDGVPLDGVRVRLGAGGVVEIAGPTLASGYWDRPFETEAAFAGGWFRTGDLGRLGSDGRLEVLGRVDDLINTGGVKVAATAVERVLAARPGVVEACVVGLPDPEWGQRVAAAVVGGSTVDDDDLRAAVRAELGAVAVPRVIRRVDRLPLRGPGKVDRAAVADLF
ncbi:MAG TPA: o-succinylbenzoate--CoA ligase [Actinophytocola sp.]|jgi:O-succinylbenzoic acid--CoA ligase|uniref:o-succinylbenzoate--CoA ligase n=1 Tax=Actinophytocola sp. TaxID=1872138 RepID=UPI002E00C8F1|nr:o-succinylbenzoate--CoA ligase [Actinophytocola sp.]